ncbi:PaaX family transcriptional regulator C-terminal domain-containing protein [Nocardioides caeni]|uniref:PaaX domain-containing protein, C-domain protein n=1 Tax=Nocardioides caeni TaxID=574700 RepID=A0A4S8N0R0_9ACTN|nr:PaaX family transcriptional regulator C-terminal domain-containing protein [Nocardioides caeni]THV09082.1 PaaX domain-containing protein, C- domain protein [Nocardioides caeni]
MPASPIRPVAARSAVLSLLIGAEVAELSARELVAGGGLVGVAESTVRAALSRMTAAGDLARTTDGYRLSDRLRERQRRQEDAVHPRRVDRAGGWAGDWEMFTVTAAGRPADERAELRSRLQGLRLAELREGLWLRPANLELEWTEEVLVLGERFVARPARSADELVALLWDLDAWAATARSLLEATRTDDPARRFAACITSARHLLADPVLPVALLPRDWPGEALRAEHLAYRAWLQEMRRAAAGG